jgi:hypothetical protein
LNPAAGRFKCILTPLYFVSFVKFVGRKSRISHRIALCHKQKRMP